MLTRTTTKLIEDLRDPDNAEAWTGFDARYRPILFGFARRLGFSADDAAEIAQQTLVEFVRCHREGRYQRGQGRLSAWLIGIARNIASNARRRQGVQRIDPGASIEAVADDETLTRAWNEERERSIFDEAISILRSTSRADPHTLQAFELFALRAVPAPEVAAQTGLSVDAVYVAKNRMTRRLRDIVAELSAAYGEDD